MNRINLARLEQVGRGATIKIAASNAMAKSKAAADYVCDGTADDVEINAAIASLDGIGGCVELSEETFNVGSASTPIILDKDNVWLKGQGKATVISGIASQINIGANGIKLSDIKFLGIICVVSGNVIISDCTARGIAVEEGAKATVTNCVFTYDITNNGNMLLISSETPVLVSVPSIIPTTEESLKEMNNIQTITFKEE
jgi:hypothetical protein